jgi:periplasmic divalent cation tolerance protein
LIAVESVYQWQGRIESSSEFLLLLKTTEERVTALKARLHRLHSYEIPEFLVLTVESGSAAYLAWLKASTVEGQ